MCGIAGRVTVRGVPRSSELAAARAAEADQMSRCIAPRGPDGEGRWDDEHATLLRDGRRARARVVGDGLRAFRQRRIRDAVV